MNTSRSGATLSSARYLAEYALYALVVSVKRCPAVSDITGA